MKCVCVCVRERPTCNITLDFLIQRFAINGAVFSTNVGLFPALLCPFGPVSCGVQGFTAISSLVCVDHIHSQLGQLFPAQGSTDVP